MCRKRAGFNFRLPIRQDLLCLAEWIIKSPVSLNDCRHLLSLPTVAGENVSESGIHPPSPLVPRPPSSLLGLPSDLSFSAHCLFQPINLRHGILFQGFAGSTVERGAV